MYLTVFGKAHAHKEVEEKLRGLMSTQNHQAIFKN